MLAKGENPGFHHEEQEDLFIGVGRPAAANTKRVRYLRVEWSGFDDGVDLARAKPDARRIYEEYAVSLCKPC